MDIQGFLNILSNHNVEKRWQDIFKPVTELSVAQILDQFRRP